ncbi:hypothetical protein EST38_g8969 [Candolleomyces aberdarensis]|uniref:Nephrocystin 3-like N-terminal domain-containing protein n=1 Tax=Candolleomyces aberdarensis TaxID=2316362 RepID=A0A4Q2DCZ1_9AGAR|nr:hypothetical protein EST38_g8969 [Candolleomyces aberdarensis]
MPPKSKRRGLKSIFAGLGSLFRPSKGSPRDEEPTAHDMPTVEGSPNNVHGLTPLGRPEGSTMGAATIVNASEDPPPPNSDVDPSTTERADRHPPLTEHTSSMSIFSNAQNFKLDNVNFNLSQHVHNTRDSRQGGWTMLLENIASNALHDSRARFDAPKCDEDTRVEVIKELMDWIQDREAPQRLLCMTGAAGAGKSALQQTIAGKCSKSNTLGSAFFFSAGDPTRNDLTHIVPTIACQLGLRNPALRDAIGNAIGEDPLIFEKTIGIQIDTLIVAPFQHVCASGRLDSSTFPHAILIDGLDECSGEDSQDELLSTIKHCLLDNDLPFRIFIASRPEWAIRSALDNEPEGYLYQLAYHIKLSDIHPARGAEVRGGRLGVFPSHQ